MALGRPVRTETDAGIPERLHYQPGLQLEKLSGCKAGGADREQRGADYGAETGRSKLPASESRGEGAESEYRRQRGAVEICVGKEKI